MARCCVCNKWFFRSKNADACHAGIKAAEARRAAKMTITVPQGRGSRPVKYEHDDTTNEWYELSSQHRAPVIIEEPVVDDVPLVLPSLADLFIPVSDASSEPRNAPDVAPSYYVEPPYQPPSEPSYTPPSEPSYSPPSEPSYSPPPSSYDSSPSYSTPSYDSSSSSSFDSSSSSW